MKFKIVVLFSFICLNYALADDSEEIMSSEPPKLIFRNLVRPFRMEKLNLVWIKAQQRLTEQKLQSLYTQMKIVDKEEIQYKQADRQTDSDGVIAAQLREKLIGIMRSYNLLDYDNDHNKYGKAEKYEKYGKDKKSDYYNNKVGTFKDKKLNRLWDKAEVAGFTPDELDNLKKEFTHYEQKLEVYYKIFDDLDEKIKDRSLNTVNEEEFDIYNEVVPDDQLKDAHKEYMAHANELREKHRDLKDSFEHLEKKSMGRGRREFIEPKVIGLWNKALESNFTAKELAALKEELFHFESRILKLSHLYADHVVSSDKYKGKNDKKAVDKLENMDKNIKKQARKVEKLQESLERQIYRHPEL